MAEHTAVVRDIAALEVLRTGRVEETGDLLLPYRLIGSDGIEVDAVTEFRGVIHPLRVSANEQKNLVDAQVVNRPNPDCASSGAVSSPADQIRHRLRRGRAGGRPPGFSSEAYKQRNAVERCINRLKQWCGLAMRTDKLAIVYQAAFHFAAIIIWSQR